MAVLIFQQRLNGLRSEALGYNGPALKAGIMLSFVHSIAVVLSN